MDPRQALIDYMTGADVYVRRDYNNWIKRGGFGARVEVSPACDCWMMGDRFGEVVKITSLYYWVKMDRSGKVRKFVGHLIYKVI